MAATFLVPLLTVNQAQTLEPGKRYLLRCTTASIVVYTQRNVADKRQINLTAGDMVNVYGDEVMDLSLATVGGVVEFHPGFEMKIKGSSGAPVNVIVNDVGGNQGPQTYLGGAAAPMSGIWKFAAGVTVAATALTINNGGGAIKLLPPGRTEASLEITDLELYQYPVSLGITYTIAGGTVNDGKIVAAG